MVAVATERKKANDNAVDGEEEEVEWHWKGDMYAKKRRDVDDDDDKQQQQQQK